ncbi:MAG: hypothetical protein AAF571_00340 [Verrucomicrobiota bacterium]
MMQFQPQALYQHSGKFTLKGLMAMAVSGLIAGVICGTLYALAIRYIPFIYLNFLVTFGFGLIMSAAIGVAAKSGHVRNRVVIGITGFFVALISLYWSYVFKYFILTGYQGMVFNPQHLWILIELYVHSEPWSLGSSGNLAPGPAIHYLLMVLEFVIIVVLMGTLLTSSNINDEAYCEESNEWAELTEVLGPFKGLTSHEQLTQTLSNGGFGWIPELEPATETDMSQLKVDVLQAPNHSQFNLITLKELVYTQKKGQQELECKENTLVSRAFISTDALNELKQKQPQV